MAYVKLKRWQDAGNTFKKAVSLKPDDAQAHFGLCAYYIQKEDREAAAKEFIILKKLDPKLAQNLEDLLKKSP